jgi:hypothetical protein
MDRLCLFRLLPDKDRQWCSNLMKSFPLRIKYLLFALTNLQMLIHLYTGQSNEGSAHEVKVQGHSVYRPGRLLFH